MIQTQARAFSSQMMNGAHAIMGNWNTYESKWSNSSCDTCTLHYTTHILYISVQAFWLQFEKFNVRMHLSAALAPALNEPTVGHWDSHKRSTQHTTRTLWHRTYTLGRHSGATGSFKWSHRVRSARICICITYTDVYTFLFSSCTCRRTEMRVAWDQCFGPFALL